MFCFRLEGDAVRKELHESRVLMGPAPRTEAGVFMVFDDEEEVTIRFSAAEAQIANMCISKQGLNGGERRLMFFWRIEAAGTVAISLHKMAV